MNSFVNTLEFIENEIDLQVESLKCYLDILANNLNKSVQDLSKKIDYSKDLCDDGNLKIIQKLICHNYRRDLPSKEHLGRLHFYYNENQFLNSTISKLEIKDKLTYPMGMCILNPETSNSNLALLDFNSSSIFIFDKDLKLKNQYLNAKDLVAESIRPFRIETDSKNYFYLLDKNTYFIYMFDFKLLEFKKVISINESIYKCKDISFVNNYLYTLDSISKNIKVFTSEGVFKKTIEVNNDLKSMTSFRISSICNLIAIANDEFKEIKLFDLNGSFKYSLKTNECFDSFCFADKSLLILNNNGKMSYFNTDNQNINDSYSINLYNDQFKNDSNFLIYFNRKILISYTWKRHLCILK